MDIENTGGEFETTPTGYSRGKDHLDAVLTRLEQNITDYKAKKRDNTHGQFGTDSPVSKALNLSISMFDKISKSLNDSIDKYEIRLNSTQSELEQISLAIDQNLDPEEKENLKRMDNSLEEIEVVAEYPAAKPDGHGHLTGSYQKNKFTASRGESLNQLRSTNEEILPQVEEFFKTAQAKHGISFAFLDLKAAVTRLLRGEKLVYIKANLVSNHHLLYEVLILAEKKVFAIFLNPNMEAPMKIILPKAVQIINITQLSKVGPEDVLVVENGEAFEDMPPQEYRRLKYFLRDAPGFMLEHSSNRMNGDQDPKPSLPA